MTNKYHEMSHVIFFNMMIKISHTMNELK